MLSRPFDGAAGPDLAALVARFTATLHDAGLPVGPDRAQRLVQAIVAAQPRTVRQLYWCALATLTSSPGDAEVLEAVFGAVFGGLADDGGWRGGTRDDPSRTDSAPGRRPPAVTGAAGPAGLPSGAWVSPGTRGADHPSRTHPVRAVASDAERLTNRDFAELSADELATLAQLMARFRVATPQRRSRRTRRAPHGHLVDLRGTLRLARRTAGDPLTVARRARRRRHRPLVVLCDISASMEPYARAMLQLLICARLGARAEVFTFATRLTRLTRELDRPGGSTALALRRAGEAAPDWSGGTRIGAALKGFNDRFGCRGMARGAVVLIISDGWETGDAARLGAEMARLSRVAHRIVWANPRTQSARYRPQVGGMAAAWPYCDAVVSAHRLSAVDDLLAALADQGGTPGAVPSRSSGRAPT